MQPIVLASSSRYRKSLLSRLRIPFTCDAPGIDESPIQKLALSPQEITERLALEKAKAVRRRHGDAIVIGSDQLACLGNEILGKPFTFEAALTQLTTLKGKGHELVTSVVVLSGDQVKSHTDHTRLVMRNLDRAAIERYLKSDEPFDCAGSYKIESLGISLFEKIEGEDPTAIEGLPLIALTRLLREFGVTIP